MPFPEFSVICSTGTNSMMFGLIESCTQIVWIVVLTSQALRVTIRKFRTKIKFKRMQIEYGLSAISNKPLVPPFRFILIEFPRSPAMKLEHSDAVDVKIFLICALVLHYHTCMCCSYLFFFWYNRTCTRPCMICVYARKTKRIFSSIQLLIFRSLCRSMDMFDFIMLMKNFTASNLCILFCKYRYIYVRNYAMISTAAATYSRSIDLHFHRNS